MNKTDIYKLIDKNYESKENKSKNNFVEYDNKKILQSILNSARKSSKRSQTSK